MRRSTCLKANWELVAGYFIEYSSMSFALFFLGEYANMILMSRMTTVLFLGGWLPPLDIWPLNLVPGHCGLLLKSYWCSYSCGFVLPALSL